MAQRSHVPKFGGWDNDNNVPYTAYFENARKEKAGDHRIMINPNDPEQNPEAFIHIRDIVHQFSPHQRMTSESHSQKITCRKSIRTGSGSSDKSNSNYSSLQPAAAAAAAAGGGGGGGYGHEKSDGNKVMTSYTRDTSSSSSISAGPRHSRHRSGSRPTDNITQRQHHRTASVPRFGAWDETDPNSGEGFTVIFDRVKEEKQIASASFQSIPPQPTYYSEAQTKYRQGDGCSSSGSKFCCCFFSRPS